MTNARTPRDLTSRELDSRPKKWQRPELLPEPDKEAGYVYRWVRVSSMNVADARNISSAQREGWEPVGINEQPKFKMLVDRDSRFADNIEIGGLLLCKCPIEFMEDRAAHYAKLTDDQEHAVDNDYMKISDSRMPVFSEKKSTVKRGSRFGDGT